jgi:hypothetical protein
MTPKEKCDEIFEMYYQRIFENLGTYCVVTAKQCALICVEEILDYCGDIYDKEFMQRVKTEIEKL